jgi:serine/threonine protein kinase
MVTIKRTIVQKGRNPFDFQTKAVIACNDFGSVELVQDSNRDLIRKIKKVNGDNDIGFEKLQELQQREADFLLSANHPAFPKAYGYFNGSTEEHGWVTSLVRDFIPGRNLEEEVKAVGRFGTPIATDYALQIGSGLEYVHDKGLLFRDLKPSNIILQKMGSKGTIKLVDLDGLGRDKNETGLGGSTIGLGTAGWHHPLSMGGLATQRTDLFALGTTLYFLVTGEKANFTMTDDARVTLEQRNFDSLEQRLKTETGGPELARVIERLVEPNPEKQYSSVKEVISELRTISSICTNGYDSIDSKFRVYKEPLSSRLKKKFSESFEIISAIVSNPFGAAVSAALITGLTGYAITDAIMQGKSKDRAVFFAPESAYELEDVTAASARIQNLTNGVGALYVQLCRDDDLNDVVLLRRINSLIQDTQKTKEEIATASEDISPFLTPVSKIDNGGEKIRSSFIHRKHDNYHTEVYTTEECTTSNNQTTCTPQVHTRQVYDNTDHYWELNKDELIQGSSMLSNGILGMQEVLPTPIYVGDLALKEVPTVDSLKREILEPDNYRKGYEEWFRQGPISFWNNLSNLDGVSQNSAVINLQADIEKGLSNQKYPLESHARNTCSSCDERDAPEGYIITRRVSETTNSYASNHQRLVTAFGSTIPRIDSLTTELSSLARDLENGDKVKDADLRVSADLATEIYKGMVPVSMIAPPTAFQQKWLPIGIGGGSALLFGLIAGIGVHMYPRSNIPSRRRYR